MAKDYPATHRHLKGLVAQLGSELPDTLEGFSGLHLAAVADGALDTKLKELIAIGIAISVRCDGCISDHVHDALEAGASRAEITETIGVAIMMGGGPSLMYGAEALEAVEQFSAAGVA